MSTNECRIQNAKCRIQNAELRVCDAIITPPSDEGGGKIFDFDGGRDSFTVHSISPSVCYADSSLVRGSQRTYSINIPTNYNLLNNATKNPPW